MYAVNRHNLEAWLCQGRCWEYKIELSFQDKPTACRFIGKAALDGVFKPWPLFLSNLTLEELGEQQNDLRMNPAVPSTDGPPGREVTHGIFGRTFGGRPPLISSSSPGNTALQLKPGAQNTAPPPVRRSLRGQHVSPPGWLRSAGQAPRWRRWKAAKHSGNLARSTCNSLTPFPTRRHVANCAGREWFSNLDFPKE